MILQLQPEYKNRNEWIKLAKAEKMRFEVIDFSRPGYDKSDTENMVSWYTGTGRVKSLHGNFIGVNPASSDENIAELSKEKAEESFVFASKLGAENIIFHSGAESFLRGSYIDSWAKRTADFYCSMARKYGKRVFIENSQDVDPDPIYQLMRQCEVDYVRVCLDIGHVNYSREPLQVWVDKLRDYIGYIHLSDNMGMFDDHLPLGDGIVHWDLVNEICKNKLDNPIITLETGDIDSTIKSIEFLKKHNYIITPDNSEKMHIFPAKEKKYNLSKEDKEAIKDKKNLTREKKYQNRNKVLNDIFSRYLSNEIVNHIIEDHNALELGGAKKQVTMLMSDLHGFTSISEDMEATDLISLLNQYFKEMTDVTHRYHGTIIDMIGDGMLVAFGVFEDNVNHADRAISAAIEMQCAMEKVNAWTKEHHFPVLHQGIGINTGDVVVGNIGSSRHTKYGLVGKHVNLCSRIQSYTYNGQILISQDTKEYASVPLTVERSEKVYPKGAKSPITLYHVTKIGDPYNKECWSDTAPYHTLKRPLGIKFSFVLRKHRDAKVYRGNITKISAEGGFMKTRIDLSKYDNNIVLDVGFPLFCRATEHTKEGWHLHFTSLPMEFDEWIYNITKNSL